MAENAATIAEFLSRKKQPTILVSLSKGSADVRSAFERPQLSDALVNVRAWLSISGIITGTPLVDWLRARPLRCCGVRMLLRLRRQRFAVVDELRRSPLSPLHQPMTLPRGVRLFHVLGFPRTSHLSDAWAQRGHARLAPLGPNDGGGILLVDALRLPGHLYPAWGADHYLRPDWMDDVLLKIFQQAAQPAQPPVEAAQKARP
jgi:hypothetical protein